MKTEMKQKTVYGLRIRCVDSEPWSMPTYYPTRKQRDNDARINRILGGMRVHSFEEEYPEDVADKLYSALTRAEKGE